MYGTSVKGRRVENGFRSGRRLRNVDDSFCYFFFSINKPDDSPSHVRTGHTRARYTVLGVYAIIYCHAKRAAATTTTTAEQACRNSRANRRYLFAALYSTTTTSRKTHTAPHSYSSGSRLIRVGTPTKSRSRA